MDRAFLVLVMFRQERGIHRPAGDRAFEERAGIEADDGGAVEQRIEVVACARRRPPDSAPTARRRPRTRGRRLPTLSCGMDAGARGPASTRAASTRLRAARGPTAARSSASLALPWNSAEHTYSRNGRPGGSPTFRQKASWSIDGRRSNHWSKHCAPVTTTRSGGTACSVIASSPLRVVPDEHAVGNGAQNRLAREVIPAPDAQRRRIPERPRRLQAIELRRRDDADERREQHDVGLLLAEKRVDRRRCAESPARRPGARPRRSRGRARCAPPLRPPATGRSAARAPSPARAASGAPAISGVEIPQVVERHPQLGGERGPPVVAARHPAERHARVFARQPLHHLAAAEILFALGGEVQLMTTRGRARQSPSRSCGSR